MNRLWKYVSLLVTIVLTIGLMACSSESVTSQNIDSKVKQEVKVNETKDHSEAVVKTSDKLEINTTSSSKSNNDAIEKVSSEVKEEQAPSTVKVETKAEVNPSTKVTEKAENAVKTEKQDSSKPSSSNEIKKEATNTSTVKVTKETTKSAESKPTVAITIIGPKDFGVILPKIKVNLSEGDTVLDVLLKAAKKKNILVEYSGTGAMAYIEGIDNIYEFDYGPKSGWNFKLNGTTVSKSSGNVKVKKDDNIEWVYSEDFTEDNE